MNLPELKGIIANSEMDVYIVRGDVATIMTALQGVDINEPLEKVTQAVTELRADPYFTRIARDIR